MVTEIDEVERLIHSWLLPYCASRPNTSVERFAPVSRTRPSGRPSADEARALLEGLKAGIVLVDDIGYFSYPTVGYAPRWGPLWLFRRSSKDDPQATVHVWWEVLTQTMAVVELVVDHGWTPSQIGVDIDRDTFDVGAFENSATQPTIAGEAKPTEGGLDKLLAEMRRCAAAACSPETEDRSDGHKKYLGLMRLRPPVFWAVAPGVRLSFSVDYEADVASFAPIDDVPGPNSRSIPVSRSRLDRHVGEEARSGLHHEGPGLTIHEYGNAVFCPVGAFVRGRALHHKPTVSREYRLTGVDESGPQLHEIWKEKDVGDGQRRYKHGRDPRLRGNVTGMIETVAPITVLTRTPGGETEGEFRERISRP